MSVIKKPSYNISVISFDLDDTLWPVAPIITAAENNFYRQIQDKYPRISNSLSNEQLRDKRIEYMRTRPHLHHDLSTLRTHFIDELLREHNYEADHERQLMRQFKEHRNKVSFYPGTLEALERLAAKYTLVACTNGNADVFKTQAGQFFSHSISSEKVGVAKPDKRIFASLCSALGCRAPDVLHIGDNPQTDALGALHAGMHSIWFNQHNADWPHPQRPHATITHLDELADLLPA
ncbi:MAG: HAD family hydrolase [Granulosicoccaceae bacterium]